MAGGSVPGAAEPWGAAATTGTPVGAEGGEAAEGAAGGDRHDPSTGVCSLLQGYRVFSSVRPPNLAVWCHPRSGQVPAPAGPG